MERCRRSQCEGSFHLPPPRGLTVVSGRAVNRHTESLAQWGLQQSALQTFTCNGLVIKLDDAR